MEERRQIQRTSVLKNAKIILNNSSSLHDCTVLNLTNVGSCIALALPTIHSLSTRSLFKQKNREMSRG